MPDPDSIRILMLIAFPILFTVGFWKPIYMPISFMTLLLGKLCHFYPILISLQAEAVIGVIGLVRVLAENHNLTKLSISYDSVNKYSFLFLLSISVSFILALDHQYSWDVTLYDFIKVIIIYAMALASINHKKDLKIITWSFVILFTCLTYEPFYGFITKTGGTQLLYGTNYIANLGILSGHVALANNMNQMIPIALFLLLSVKKKIFRIVATFPLLIFIGALIGSGSRGGVVGFTIFCATLVYFSKNRVKNAIVCGVIIMMLFVSASTFKYTASRIDKVSTMGRLQGLFHGIEMLLKGNLLGVGPGCFPLARSKYFGYTMASHNIYGQVIGDLGIPGTIAWFFLIRQIFLNLVEAKKRMKALSMENDFLYKLAMGIQISLIVRLFISMASHGLYYFYWYVMAALSIAILKQVESLANDEPRDEANA